MTVVSSRYAMLDVTSALRPNTWLLGGMMSFRPFVQDKRMEDIYR